MDALNTVFSIFGQLISFLFNIKIPGLGSVGGIMMMCWFLVFIGWCLRTLLGSNIDGGDGK